MAMLRTFQQNYRYVLILLASSLLYHSSLQAQHAVKGLKPSNDNYTSFFQPSVLQIAEVQQHNKGYEQNPELGLITEVAPCAQCYELIGERTLTSKTYIKAGTGGKERLFQNSTHPLHYKDAQGNLRTIHSVLQPSNKQGIYTATEQEVPVIADAQTRQITLGKTGRQITLNSQLELIFKGLNGTETNLGSANWNNHTAGDNGIYVHNAWPGIDIEMRLFRGGMKTNFIINKPLPSYALGELLVRDHTILDKALHYDTPPNTPVASNLEIKNQQQEVVYKMSQPVVFEKNNAEQSIAFLSYQVHDNQVLDIAVPGNFLNRSANSYPVILDPLVIDSTSVGVPGSSYTNTIPYSGGCTIVNNLTVPAGILVTDLMFSLTYITSGGAFMVHGAEEYFVGTCKSPPLTAWYWSCPVYTTGTCDGWDVSFYNDMMRCIPAPTCSTYVLPVTLNFYQIYRTTAPCTNTYISAITPFTVIVTGHTVEMVSTNILGDSVICDGDSTQLSSSGRYGVAPYTYSWSPGGLTGPVVTVTPSVTTTYTCTITDQCGNKDSLTKTITVYANENTGFTYSPNPGCAGVPITITGNGPGAPGNFNWVAAGSSTSSATAVKSFTTSYPGPGTYKVILNYINGFCLYPDSGLVTINAAPIVKALSNAPVCLDAFLHLDAQSSSTLSSYAWSGPAGFTSAIKNPTIFPASFANAGTYSLTVTDINGCTNTVPATTLVDVVTMNLTGVTPDQFIGLGGSVQLNAAGGVYYHWSPDDGTLSNAHINNPIATPVDTVTRYTVVAMNQWGCKDSATVTIKLDYSDFFIPNSFTPNGDGLNDVFRVVNARFDKLVAFEIYDRWGKLVFHTLDKTKGWDGTFYGEPCDLGIYHYFIILSRPDGGQKTYKGTVTLVR